VLQDQYSRANDQVSGVLLKLQESESLLRLHQVRSSSLLSLQCQPPDVITVLGPKLGEAMFWNLGWDLRCPSPSCSTLVHLTPHPPAYRSCVPRSLAILDHISIHSPFSDTVAQCLDTVSYLQWLT
jgi:hypothetical protein